MGNIEHVACNMCGKDDYRIVYEGCPDEENFIKNFSSSSDSISNDQIVECKNCGLKYVNPRLKEKLVLKGYSEESDETFISQRKGREATFNRSLEFIEKFTKKGKILDIGTAGGSFLNVARKRGWDVHGIEPNKWLCEWAKKEYGIPVKQGTLFENKFPDNHFDAVSMWDVIEHVHDPMKNIKEMHRILKPGGLLIINYPDINSSIARLMKRKWVFLLAVHLFYFTPKTISRMMQRSGFAPVAFRRHTQRLELDYLVMRMGPYSGFMRKFFGAMISAIGANKLLIPYWMGQNLVLGRKK